MDLDSPMIVIHKTLYTIGLTKQFGKRKTNIKNYNAWKDELIFQCSCSLTAVTSYPAYRKFKCISFHIEENCSMAPCYTFESACSYCFIDGVMELNYAYRLGRIS